MTRPATFETLLAAYPAEIGALAAAARESVFEAVPDALETIDAPSKLIAYGFGPKLAQIFAAIMPYRAHVNLTFSRGVDLPDPMALLAGTGKKARHVRLESEAGAHLPAVRDLLRGAAALAERP